MACCLSCGFDSCLRSWRSKVEAILAKYDADPESERAEEEFDFAVAQAVNFQVPDEPIIVDGFVEGTPEYYEELLRRMATSPAGPVRNFACQYTPADESIIVDHLEIKE